VLCYPLKDEMHGIQPQTLDESNIKSIPSNQILQKGVAEHATNPNIFSEKKKWKDTKVEVLQ
jgi:hypothetical protein